MGDTLTPEKLRAVLRQVARDAPTGFSVHPKAPMTGDRMAELIGDDPPPSIARAWIHRAAVSLGTLGGGNHFLEVQCDDQQRVHFMLHSGSRNLGKQVCGEAAFRKHASVHRFERLGDVRQNYAEAETHGVVWRIVHRKGAVRATAGETVLIPGSMGTSSYVGEGLGSQASFESCQHGAGRALGRNEAKRRKTSEQVFAEMAALGVKLLSGEPRTAAEEAPFAYKDIDAVMAASADLVRPVLRLRALAVVKG